MIDRIGGFLQHNLIVLLAVVLVPMKLLVLRVVGDTEGQSTALLAIPEDSCYVALGLILGDVATGSHAFQKNFSGSAHASLDIVVTAVINVGVAVIIHKLAMTGNDHFNIWRAADVARVSDPSSVGPQQIELPLTPTDQQIRMIQVRHLAIFSLLYAIQMWIVVRWIAWIAKVMANA